MTPNDFQQRAHFFFERDRWREAVEVCQEGLGVFPEDADLLYLQGLCGLRLKDRELTASSIQSLTACAPEWACTFDLLCYQALEDDKFDAAERQTREGIRLAPETGMRYGTLAYIFQRMHRLEDAITAARQGLKLEPHSGPLLTLLQRLYQINGEKRLAAEMERRAGEVNPEDADWHLFAGFRLLEEGQQSKGRSRLRSSLMAEPNVPAERLDAMAQEIVCSHWLFKHAFFLKNDRSLRVMAVATPFVWFALGWLVWRPIGWLGWLSALLVVGWFAYEALFFLCRRWVRRGIARGRL